MAHIINSDTSQEVPISYLDTDTTLAANSDVKVATQKAVKAYVDTHAAAGTYTVLNGSGAPSGGTGADGDFYINTTTWFIYGPKASGTWPSGVSLVGPTGATGSTGATGATGPQGSLSSDNPIDTPPGSANAMDDEFSGASLDVKWTWVGQSTVTATVGSGELQMTSPASIGNTLRFIEQALPAGDWTFVAKVYLAGISANFITGSLGIYDASGGRLETIDLLTNTGYEIRVNKWNSASSSNAETMHIVGLTGFTRWVYLRLRKVSTTLYFELSEDGVIWLNPYIETTWTSWVAAPSHVMLAVANSTTQPVVFHVNWFRRTA